MHKEKEKLIKAFIVAADIAFAIISFRLALYLKFGAFTYDNKDSIILHLLIVAFWLILASTFEINRLFRSRPYSLIFFNSIVMVFVSTALITISIFSLDLFFPGLIFLVIFSTINLSLSFGFKLLTYKLLKIRRKRGLNYLNILVIGDHTANAFLRQIFSHPEWGYRVVAFIGIPCSNNDFKEKYPVLPGNTDIDKLLRDKPIDEVILFKENTKQNELEDLVEICSEMGVVFRMNSPFFNMLANKTRVQYFGTLPMLTVSSKSFNYIELKIKRLVDVVFSSMAIALLFPLLLIIALVVKYDSKGSVIFKQRRVGLRGRKFMVYKFRTMVINADKLKKELEDRNEMDGPVFKISNDPRITRVGKFLRKFSLDELPQFINVVRGDMSIVGPRPPLPTEVQQYKRWQLRRLSMKPGITCIWQVSGRNSIPFEEWMKMDLQYIDNWSLKLDFVICMKTVRAIFRGEGQ